MEWEGLIYAGVDKIRMARLFTGPEQECRLGVVDRGRACRKNGMGVHEWMMYKQHAQLEQKTI